MNTKTMKIISGCILEDEEFLSLAELCQTCHVSAEVIIQLIDYGVIAPQEGKNSQQWRFHRSVLVRADKALRLRRDLGVNISGVALALDLLDQIDDLKRQLKQLKNF